MENMRTLLRRNLGRSLEALTPLDRLRAAWPVVCGRAMAGQATLLSLENGTLTVEVVSAAWHDELNARSAVLEHDLARVARVPLTGIHFVKAVGG